VEVQEQEALTCFMTYKHLFWKDLKSTIRKYSGGVELDLEPTEEEPLHQDFLVEQEW
jgi:hypothetical protein